MNDLEKKYPGNSHKTQEAAEQPREKRNKVIKGSARTKKQSFGKQMMQNFVSEDFDNIGSYVMADIVLPASKKLLDDVFMGGLDIVEDIFKTAVFGSKAKRRRSSYSGSKTSYTSYNSMSSNNRGSRRDVDRSKTKQISSKATHDFDDIILETRGDAEAVLSEMFDLLQEYGFVCVGDLLDLVDITGSHTDQKWGWSDLEGAKPLRVRDGYILKLPRTRQLD